MSLPIATNDRVEFARWCEAEDIRTVVSGAADLHGVWRGKRLPVEEFLAHLDHGVPFSDVLLVITHAEDADDGQELVEPPGGAAYPYYFPRKEQGFPDILVVPDLSSARRLSWHEGTLGVVGDFHLPSGDPVPIGSRNVLRRLIERARSRGLEPKVGLEYEFFIFRGGFDSLAESGWRLEPLYARPYTYSVYRGGLDEELIGEVRRHMTNADVSIEASNPETGPGQYELNLHYADALKAADDGFIYKNGIKEIIARRGLTASFMAKPSRKWAGSSCHIHQSLWDVEEDTNVLFDHALGHGLSETARCYIGGLLATMREFTAFFAPTPNSYKRFVPYSWAGTSVSWGYDNRSNGIRAIAETAPVSRVEHRLPGADTNPYVAIAACLAGGLYGLEHKLDPHDAYEGDAYDTKQFESVPQSLDEALDLLEKSEIAQEMLGEDFVRYYVIMKRFEAERYRQQVSEWEVRRYVEMA
ncbi:MAG TPA: glutamine synthetase family protein [Acidimicrobiales bacterium]|nr:glutamine synthetase family protein [Acidimicrobiales bacterium]